MHEIEVFTCIDSNGDYACGTTAEAAIEKYEEDVGDVNSTDGFRIIKAIIAVPLPKEIVLRGTVSGESESTLTVA